jgi:ubiquinone/menaquinone biosynthesis C-methylase UbiE
MIALTEQAAKAAGVAQLTAVLGDAIELDFPPDSFDLVVALGVLPWLYSQERALAAMARVLRPGGFCLFTADNRERLDRLLDPRSTPLFGSARALLKEALAAAGLPRSTPLLDPRKHSPAEVDRLVRGAGLQKIRSTTVGFGPLSIFGRGFLGNRAGIRLHHRLQRLADAGWPLVRVAGVHYMVLATKPPAIPEPHRD